MASSDAPPNYLMIPSFATPTDVKRMASRLLNDEKNAPNAEKSRSQALDKAAQKAASSREANSPPQDDL